MLNKYFKDTSGNIAAIFAVCLMMLMAGVGVAVDYNSMASRRVFYQGIADSAVLGAVQSRSTDHAELLEIARKIVDEHNDTGTPLSTTLTIDGDNKVRVYVSGSYDTVLMGLFGTEEADVKVVAESLLGVSGYINLVLVLDGTASMGYNSRLTNMKAAATQLITDLEDFESDNLLISVVPFSQYVSVDPTNRNEPWVDVPPDWIEILPEVCTRPVIGTENCRWVPYGPTSPTSPGTCTNDGVTYSCGGSSGSPGGTRWTCDSIYGDETCSIPTKLHTWNGVIGSRRNPHNKRKRASRTKRVPGILDLTGSATVLPLTKNLSTVKSKIASVTSRGETYMPAGLMWGWRALSRDTPFTEATSSPEPKVRNVMVFMTDGYNTISATDNTHDGRDRNEADNLTAEMCRNIKADDVEIYSITYEVMDSSSRTLVSNCATSSEMYYDAANGSELAKAFTDIGRSILSPYLTH